MGAARDEWSTAAERGADASCEGRGRKGRGHSTPKANSSSPSSMTPTSSPSRPRGKPEAVRKVEIPIWFLTTEGQLPRLGAPLAPAALPGRSQRGDLEKSRRRGQAHLRRILLAPSTAMVRSAVDEKCPEIPPPGSGIRSRENVGQHIRRGQGHLGQIAREDKSEPRLGDPGCGDEVSHDGRRRSIGKLSG